MFLQNDCSPFTFVGMVVRILKCLSSFREFEQTNSNFCCLVTRSFRKFSDQKNGRRTQRAGVPGEALHDCKRSIRNDCSQFTFVGIWYVLTTSFQSWGKGASELTRYKLSII